MGYTAFDREVTGQQGKRAVTKVMACDEATGSRGGPTAEPGKFN
jgi:hypothetical protein